MATSIVVLPEASRGSLAFGHVGDAAPTPYHQPAGVPALCIISFPSVDWVSVAKRGTLQMSVALERSLDNGLTWVSYGGFGGGVNTVGKNGQVVNPSLEQFWDGQDMLLRGSVTVNTPFSWGVTVTI